MALAPVSAVVFDMTNVFDVKAHKLLADMRESSTWHDYVCGRISEQECFSCLAKDRNASITSIKSAVHQSRDSYAQNDEVVETIKQFREQHQQLRVYGILNISKPDWTILRARPFHWDIFDRTFTSWEAAMCQPDLLFYRHVLKSITVPAEECVFIGGGLDGVIATKSIGFQAAWMFDHVHNIPRKLRNLTEDPSQRGRHWLGSHAKKLYSESDTGAIFYDNFAQLLIYEVTRNMDLLSLRHSNRTWNYFIGNPCGTTKSYPDDVDTTSYALKLLPQIDDIVQSLMDDMVSPQQTTADGIIRVYFDSNRNRVDPAVCINVLRFYFHHGRGDQRELQPTKSWIHDVLVHRAYLYGTRYYHSPDTFLYFFARLLKENPSSDISCDLPLLRTRLCERINCPADVLGLAMRLLACHFMGICNKTDMQRLLSMQQEDGSFGIGWLCRYGKTEIKIGNRGLTTALSVHAIELATRSQRQVTMCEECE